MDYLSSPDLKYLVVQMIPFKQLLKTNSHLTMPIYQQVSNKLIDLIREGVIRPGTPLPSTREMAAILQVHRKTVVAAYEELNTQDWIEILPRKGIRVAPNLPELKPRSFKAARQIPAYVNVASFPFFKLPASKGQPMSVGQHRLIINDGFPDARISPIKQLLKIYSELFTQNSIQRKIMYGDLQGSQKLRQALSVFLSDTRGMNITANNVLITRGAQMAIYLAGRLIIKPGSVVVVGEPNYAMANSIFSQFGAKLERIPVDERGIDVERLEIFCKRRKPDLLYIIPHHHHPTTVTLSAERRMKLLELIRKYNFPVIEDDYDYDFHYSSSPILPLASADHRGNVIYIGSISKSFTTTLKVGYMIAPENFIAESSQMRKLIDIRGDNIMEEALGEMFQHGDMQRHFSKSLKLYHQRRDLMCELLKTELGNKISFQVPQGGMAIWVRFAKDISLESLSGRVSMKGLYLSDGNFYNTGNTRYNAVRMGFASLNEKEMTEAIAIIKKAI